MVRLAMTRLFCSVQEHALHGVHATVKIKLLGIA